MDDEVGPSHSVQMVSSVEVEGTGIYRHCHCGNNHTTIVPGKVKFRPFSGVSGSKIFPRGGRSLSEIQAHLG